MCFGFVPSQPGTFLTKWCADLCGGDARCHTGLSLINLDRYV